MQKLVTYKNPKCLLHLLFQFGIFFILSFFLIAPINAKSHAQIIGVKTADFSDKFRIVINFKGHANAIFNLDSSRRNLVIKLTPAILDTKIENILATDSIVKNFYEIKEENGVKLVLDFKNGVKYKHFVMHNPDRFIIEIFSDINAYEPKHVEAYDQEPATLQFIDKNFKEPENISHKHISENKETHESVSYKKTEHKKKSHQNAEDNYYEANEAQASSTHHYADTGSQPKSSKRDIVVIIDPGHGGKDPGAIGSYGSREKDVVLKVAQFLQYRINQKKGFKAILTRRGDYFIPLRTRLNIAHKNKADMFISVHADAYKYQNSYGASVFALSQRGATSEAAKWIAKKENESELGQVISDKNAILRSVLIDLAQTDTISKSLEIGNSMLYKLSRITRLHSRKVEQAAFVVLKSPDIPSLLVETGFISEPHEEMRLRSSDYQQLLAFVLAEGITRYFIDRPPPGTYLAMHGD